MFCSILLSSVLNLTFSELKLSKKGIRGVEEFFPLQLYPVSAIWEDLWGIWADLRLSRGRLKILITWSYPVVPGLQSLYLFFISANKVWNLKTDYKRNSLLVFIKTWLRKLEQVVLPSFLCFHLPCLMHRVLPWVTDEEFLLKKVIVRGFRRCCKEEFSMGNDMEKCSMCHSSRESKWLDKFRWEDESPISSSCRVYVIIK